MHQAIVAKVESVHPISNADRIQVAKVLGESCIVSKDIQPGYVGVLFPADLALSEQYCHENNLNRDSSLNKDTSKKGFFDANRKVRAQVFLGVRSTAYFASLDSLKYASTEELLVGQTFNELSGVEICKRYVSPEQERKAANIAKSGQRKKNEIPLFLKHKDSAQFRHCVDNIPVGALLSFHSKRHGTSWRVGNLPVKQNLPKWKKLVNKVVDIFPEEQYEIVVGTRNVVIKDSNKVGYHGSEKFRVDIADELAPHLGKGVCLYGEVVGFVNGKPIMNPHDIKTLKDSRYVNKYGKTVNYSYGCKEHEYKFFVYRMTVVGSDGNIYEVPQKQLEKWCQERNISHTLEVHPQVIYDGDSDKLKHLVEVLTEREDVLCEDYTDPTHISEGIIVRCDYADKTEFYKSKSTPFRICEGILAQPDIEDMS